jgi:hypothetical protein
MHIDQPRQHGRVALIDQLTIGGRLVRGRLDSDDAPVLEEHSGTTAPEIFAIEGIICTEREHTVWLPNTPAPVNALPMWRASARSLSLACEKNSDQPACPSDARPCEPSV